MIIDALRTGDTAAAVTAIEKHIMDAPESLPSGARRHELQLGRGRGAASNGSRPAGPIGVAG